MATKTIRPSQLLIPVGYPNDDPVGGAGQTPSDYGDDSLVTVAQLLERDTFEELNEEAQRRHLAMWVAYQIEQGERMGIGTGARSWATQLKNWQDNPKQFSDPKYSYHVDRPDDGVEGASAVDNIPGTSFGWLPGNVGRFGLIVLTGNERHHTQLVEVPKGGSTFAKDPAKYWAKVKRMDLPYLGTLSIREWLERDEPIALQGPAPKPPTTPPSQPKPPAAKPTLKTSLPSMPPVIKEGASPDRVRQWQKILNELAPHVGFATLSTDGLFGPKTTAATKRVQSVVGSAADGMVGPLTLDALRRYLGMPNKPTPPRPVPCPFTDTLEEGDSGDAVRELQTWLKGKNLYAKNVDGKYGPITRQAVQGLQRALKSHGLYAKAIDGQFGPLTLDGTCKLIARGLA